MDIFNATEIKEFYEKADTVWPENDDWHRWNQIEIKKYIHRFNLNSGRILNAGSGGNTYGLNVDMYHVDIAESKIKNTNKYVVSSVEEMPFEDNCFDVVICVGSVINYCDAVKAIGEMGRVLKRNGLLILEFENSYSFEFKNTTAFRANAAVVTTSYFNTSHKMWVYSLNYICNIMRENKLIAGKFHSFHILSSLAYFHNRNENKAAKYVCWDRILRHLPIIRQYSGNMILTARKE